MKHLEKYLPAVVIACCLTVGLCLPKGVFAQEFSALLSKRQVPLGEVFKVSFQLKGAQGGRMQYPDFKNFQLRGGPSQEQGFQSINGQVTLSTTHSFFLQGKKTGTFTIGSATLTLDGKEYKTQPVKVEITPAQNNGAGNTQANRQQDRNADIESQLKEAIFVRALLSKKQAYQGEQITVSYKLYERVQPVDLRTEEAPSYEGFWVENVDVRNPVPRMEVYNGAQYRTYVVKKDILFPQQSGKLTIEPLKLSSVVRIQSQPRVRRSIFDDFFGQFENYKYSFASPRIEVDVKSLPGGRPAGFSGLVGDLDLEVELDRTEVEVGESLTLKIEVQGQGNIKKLPAPQVSLSSDFELYDPTVSEQNSRKDGIVQGRRTYEYVIIPRNPGTFDWPAITYSYFDAEAGKYRTLSSEAYQVTVKGDPTIASRIGSSGPVDQREVALIGQDIRYIHPVSEDLTRETGNPLAKWWVWLMYILPFVAIAGLWGVRKGQKERKADVAGTRQKKAARMARKRLTQAKELLYASDQKGFYNELIRSMWGYLGDKLQLPQSELDRERAKAALMSRTATPEQVDGVVEILDTAEMALFAPGAVVGGMQGAYERSLSLITELEEQLV